MIEPYQAIVLQEHVQEPGAIEDFRRVVRDNIWRQVLLFRRLKFSYGRARLILVTEHCMHGLDASGDQARVRAMAVPMPTDVPLWEAPGAEEMALYGMAAHELKLYVAGSGWELDPHWPELYFHTGFIISPEGKIILKMRHVNSGLGAPGTSGMYSQLIDTYGPDGAFPVVDTDIGKLGIVVGGDLLHVECSRVLRQRGCEVILHPTGSRNLETGRLMEALKRALAFQNRAYLLSANIGQYRHQRYWEPAPPNGEARDRLRDALNWGEFEFMGKSQINGPNGERLGYIVSAGEAATGVVIDIEGLRYKRQMAGWGLELHREAYAREYERFPGAPFDWQASGASRLVRQRATLAGLVERGVVRRSEAYGGELGGGQFAELPAVEQSKDAR